MLRIESLPLPKCIPQNEMHVFPAAFTGNTLWFIFFIIPQFSTGFNSRKCAATNINFHDSLPWKGRGTAVRRWRGSFVKSFLWRFRHKWKPLSQCYALPAPLSGAPHLPNFIILYNFNQYIFENWFPCFCSNSVSTYTAAPAFPTQNKTRSPGNLPETACYFLVWVTRLERAASTTPR